MMYRSTCTNGKCTIHVHPQHHRGCSTPAVPFGSTTDKSAVTATSNDTRENCPLQWCLFALKDRCLYKQKFCSSPSAFQTALLASCLPTQDNSRRKPALRPSLQFHLNDGAGVVHCSADSSAQTLNQGHVPRPMIFCFSGGFIDEDMTRWQNNRRAPRNPESSEQILRLLNFYTAMMVHGRISCN